MRLLIIILLLAPATPLSAEAFPDAPQKEKVRMVVSSLERASRRERTLDDFGRHTMRESRDILDIGGPAVYVLSLYANHPDWKVRFWIADILGYLGNRDAVRPLTRMIENAAERQSVRERARESLRALELTGTAAGRKRGK